MGAIAVGLPAAQVAVVQTSAASLVQVAPAPSAPVEVRVLGTPYTAGATGEVSGDDGNRLTRGTDSRLFVPELAIEPLAYYILAKA